MILHKDGFVEFTIIQVLRKKPGTLQPATKHWLPSSRWFYPGDSKSDPRVVPKVIAEMNPAD
jgi:hypothetical protein